MSRVLHVNGLVSDDRSDRRIVAHHRLCTLFTVKLQKGLQGEHQRKDIRGPQLTLFNGTFYLLQMNTFYQETNKNTRD